MFFGEFAHAIDNKSRYIAPAMFRDELGESFVITKGLDRCLFVYTQAVWQNKLAEMARLSSTSADARRFSRNFFSAALIATPDKQYRVVLPESLRSHAGLDKEIITIGVMDRLEIWDKATWESYNDEAATGYEAVAEKLAEIHPEILL